MPSTSQDREFADLMSSNAEAEIKVSNASLDEAIDWIARNLDPDDVFSNGNLESWAENNGYIKK